MIPSQTFLAFTIRALAVRAVKGLLCVLLQPSRPKDRFARVKIFLFPLATFAYMTAPLAPLERAQWASRP